jgi:Ni/Co efflux regulator RcnB
LTFFAAVFAQPQDNNHGGGHPSHNGPNPAHGAPHGQGRSPGPRDASMGGPGGPVPHNDWHKGERLPTEYRDRNYVVDNWHEHGLQAPPRGCIEICRRNSHTRLNLFLP